LRHLANSVGRSKLRSAIFRARPQFICRHSRGRELSTQLVKIFLGARDNSMRATWPIHRRSRRFKFLSKGSIERHLKSPKGGWCRPYALINVWLWGQRMMNDRTKVFEFRRKID
jgi:hypothetical protein